MELLDGRVYSDRYVEQWLGEVAGIAPGTKVVRQTLHDAKMLTVGDDVVFFERVSDTHCRAHRGNAKEVKEILAILDKATNSRGARIMGWFLGGAGVILGGAGVVGIVVTLVRHFILHVE